MGPFKSIDDIPNRYQFAVVISLRARELQGGAKPLMPSTSRNFNFIAHQEAMAGLLVFAVRPTEPESPTNNSGNAAPLLNLTAPRRKREPRPSVTRKLGADRDAQAGAGGI